MSTRLVAAWERYGDFMDREHGDFPNMSRGPPLLVHHDG